MLLEEAERNLAHLQVSNTNTVIPQLSQDISEHPQVWHAEEYAPKDTGKDSHLTGALCLFPYR
jgi:hypothetical protein